MLINLKLSHDVEVFRGANFLPGFSKRELGELLEALGTGNSKVIKVAEEELLNKVAREYVEKGFLSTDVVKPFNRNVEYTLTAPKGTSALDIKTITAAASEDELLFNRGYRIISDKVGWKKDDYADAVITVVGRIVPV